MEDAAREIEESIVMKLVDSAAEAVLQALAKHESFEKESDSEHLIPKEFAFSLPNRADWSTVERDSEGRLIPISSAASSSSHQACDSIYLDDFNDDRKFEDIMQPQKAQHRSLDRGRKAKGKVEVGPKRLAQLLRVADLMHYLILNGKHATKRDIYYMEKQLFSTQREVDVAVEDLSALCLKPRESLGVIAASRGLTAGWLSYREPLISGSGTSINSMALINCMDYVSTGRPISPFTDELKDIKTEAHFILVVEKDAVFSRLLSDGFCHQHRCILITGKGYPDVATRSFLRRLSQDFPRIPILILTDADPYGLEIAHIFITGSLSMSHDVFRLATPNAKWIGLRLSDLRQLGVPDICFQPFSEADKKRGSDMLQRPGFLDGLKPSWKKELLAMLEPEENGGCIKAEIQALAALGFRFLADVYIPAKLSDEKEWL